MRLYNEVVLEEEVIGTGAAYSHPFFDALLTVADELVISVVAESVGGDATWVRVDLEHSNDHEHWTAYSTVVAPTFLATTSVGVTMGGCAPLNDCGAFGRLKLTLSGASPQAKLRIIATQRRRWVPSVAIWNADFSGISPGAANALPGDLRLSRASSGTVQSSATTVQAIAFNDVARVGDDGAHWGLVFEESRTNEILDSRDIAAATWQTGSSVTTTTDTIAGPDGATLADRSEVGDQGYSNYTDQQPAAATYTLSAWSKRGSPGASWQLTLRTDTGSTNAAVGGATAPAYWQRASVTAGHTSGVVYSIPSDGRDWTAVGGITNGARDQNTDMVQLEAGAFASEWISTSGTAKTRAGERLYHPDVTALLSRGRLSIEVRLQPKGSSSEYGADPYLWSIDATNYAKFVRSTGKFEIVIGGVSTGTSVPLTWARGATLDLWVAAGGGIDSVRAHARNDGGSVQDLGSGAVLGELTATGELDLLCKGTTNQWSSWVLWIRALASGEQPSWVNP
jgi:hypothetical protein